MNLYFRVTSDYRSGISVKVYDKSDMIKLIQESSLADEQIEGDPTDEQIEDYVDSDGYFVGDTELEVKNDDEYHIYLIVAHDGIDDFYICSNKDEAGAEKSCQQLFAEFNNCLPFVVTGHTCSYKEEGYYPEPVVTDGPPLLSPENKKYVDAIIDKHFTCAVVLHNQMVVDSLVIDPLF